MLAIIEGVLTNLRGAPTVDGNVEVGIGLEGWDEASHGGQTKSTAVVGELIIGDDMAADLEFLQGDSRITARREEKHIPIVVAHYVGTGRERKREEEGGGDW